jgi:hydrophobe/amphiphile efflux-1 (HAE1) family protein
MFSRFFIERPIFASVISIVIVIAGALSIFTLPTARYPEITPPMVQVTANYPGADSQVVADTIAAPIEQEVNGVENMIYMNSTCSSNGSYALRITFELGTDIDMATVLVQNRVARAMPKLPPEVQRQGVQTKKSSTNLVNVISLYSPDGSLDDLFLTNYVTIYVKDRISRVYGVGDVSIFPEKDYSMRIWLDPTKLEYRSLTTNDVVHALQQQNVQVAAGEIGAPPVPKGQNFQLNVKTLGRLQDIDQFSNIIVRTAEGGRVTRLKDVARVEMGGKQYNTFATLNGKPCASMLVFQTPGSNALAVAEQVDNTMKELKKSFPEGMDYTIVYDTSDFIRASVQDVVKTLIEAFVLVCIVVFIFLQDWRSTLIPSATIPVSIIGTFAVMSLLGFSINMITLFGLVLSIGIVVDDAIVVVENVDRNMNVHGMTAQDASIRAMEEIGSAIVSTTLVLLAVFIPAAFMPGISGQLFRQFALTIAVSTVFSSINALTLSPALSALVMKPQKGKRNVFFRTFNRVFDAVTERYTKTVAFCVRRLAFMMVLFAGFVSLTYLGFANLPTGFVPIEDDGLIMLDFQLPVGSSLLRTAQTGDKVSHILKETKGVKDYAFLGGYSMADGFSPNYGVGFAALKPWDVRNKEGLSRENIMEGIMGKLRGIKEGIVNTFVLPAIPGLGTSGGFEMQVQDMGGLGLNALEQVASELAQDGTAQANLAGVYSTFKAGSPIVFADLDREKTLKLGIPLQSVFDTMQAYLGSAYVNDFNKFGRTWQVKIQSDSAFRTDPKDIKRLRVRTQDGHMVPLGTLIEVKQDMGPQRITRHNLFPAARIAGAPAAGVSSGQALDIMEQMARDKFPQGMSFEWTAMSYQEKKVGAQGLIVLVLSVVLVVLVLSAQYESWVDPLAVILIVPLAVLGSVIALMTRGMDNNLYTQVGLVLLVGLSAKNGILIVEFARDMRAKGMSVLESAVEAGKLRFRPILMTSLSFIIGVTPLVVASSAGAISQRSVGTVVFGGMLVVTILGVFFTPVLYVLMQGPKHWSKKTTHNELVEPSGPPSQ